MAYLDSGSGGRRYLGLKLIWETRIVKTNVPREYCRTTGRKLFVRYEYLYSFEKLDMMVTRPGEI